MLLQELIGLVESWRREAELYRRRGMRSRAQFVESCAADLEGALAVIYSVTKPIKEAAIMTGYTEITINRAVDAGDVELVDTPEGPAVRLIQLAVKTGRLHAVLGDLPTAERPDEPLRLEAARHAARRNRIRKLG